jgi:hypothetical protein
VVGTNNSYHSKPSRRNMFSVIYTPKVSSQTVMVLSSGHKLKPNTEVKILEESLEEFLVRKDVKGLIDRRLLKVISTESSSKDIISGLNLKIGNLKIDMDQDQKEFVKLKSKLRKIREIVNNELFSEKSRLSKINKILSTLGEYPDE